MNNKYIFMILIIFVLTINSNLPASGGGESLSGEQESTAAAPFSQKKFLPNIALILDFSFVRRDLNQNLFETLEIPGFIHGHSHQDGHSHTVPNAEKGFNLNYGELVLGAAVDPYFDLFTAFHLSENSFEIEEAYIESRSLPYGFRLKLGKFLSGFGRINSQHAHYWDFADTPLVYKVFFSDHGLLEKGIQLNWVAPTSFYLGVGIECLQGTNENSFGTGDFQLIDATTGNTVNLESVPLPNTWTFFGKTSFDAGDLTILAGISYAIGKTRQDHFEEEESPHGFAGHSSVMGVDFTVKYLLSSYTYLALQGEYLYRSMRGSRFLVYEPGESTAYEEEHEHGQEGYEVVESPLNKKQAGFYAQLVFRFHRLWRLGARWDQLNKNNITLDRVLLDLPGKLSRYSFIMDFSPTEFSRIRLQYSYNDYAFRETGRKKYHELALQFNLSIGAHGAHPF
ncbi:MAG: hypothetical protein MUF15_22395 [Acidobacteria bacterium]|jgi:hypothetical protein|nr:hypothetical protein [Acidobacteriota bacterium]